MSAMLIMQSLKNDPKAENAQEMLQVVDEFLDIKLQFLDRYNKWWLTHSMIVLKQLRLKLEFPWAIESTDQSHPAAVPEDRTKADEGLDSTKAPKTERDAKENNEMDVEKDVNGGFTWNIRDIFDFDN